MHPPAKPRHVAVIGSGVSGLSAAYTLSAHARVTLFESDDRIGGHADTTTVTTEDGELAIDTGFIVHNDRTYPTLLHMFDELGVRTQPSEMSLAVRADDAHGGTGLEYAGARGLPGLFGDRRNLFRLSYLKMLTEILRFHRRARRLLNEDCRAVNGTPRPAVTDETLGDFLTRGRFSDYFVEHFITPLVSTVWSCDPAHAHQYPVRYLLTFLHHHGMLRVFGSPRWRTVIGGSREYVSRIVETLTDRGCSVLPSTPVTRVTENHDGVEVEDAHGAVHHADAVIIATHPHKSLGMLGEPTSAQQEILSAIPYSNNLMQLHTDTGLLPRTPSVRGSWNHLTRDSGPVVVTYDMTRLMRLPTPGGTRHLVTLNAPDLVRPDTVINSREYSHPIYTPESVAASLRSPELDTDRVFFAGAWQGWGFHEDGARSGTNAAQKALGATEDTAALVSAEPRAHVIRTTVKHARHTPVKHRFTHRSWMWLVDLDHLPDHGRASWWRGSFDDRDHFSASSDEQRSIRDRVLCTLADHGLTAPVGRIRMAAMPRAWGNGFNPLSVFWCDTPTGLPLAAVMEVQNTYGDRHAYVVRPDDAGDAAAEKEFYVSPFHGTDGEYRIHVPWPERGQVRIGIALRGDRGDDSYRFAASVHGETVHDGEPGWSDTVRAAPAALVTTVLIRVHGVWLWIRGLPIQPRPAGGLRRRRRADRADRADRATDATDAGDAGDDAQPVQTRGNSDEHAHDRQ